ncbi:MAG: phasin family protein [Arenicellales bacterium]|nr:phasin family protein [Arenicellales bacterium]
MSAKNQNPFDFSEYFAQIDPTSVLKEWQKMLNASGLPTVDHSALFETQSKNLYALIAANQSVMAGARNLMQRQGELLQEAFAEANRTIQDMGKISDPAEAAEKQAEMVKAACDKALANFTEISDMVAKNYQEAAETINQRFSESLNEIKNAITENK